MDKISVIIPVFNGETYLAECLDSLLNQTYQNLEIILVNDGSTDSSLSICIDYARKDSRIKLFNQSNTGRNIARNVGIQLSTGDYISFIDQDDLILANYYEDLIKQAKNYHSKIAICNFASYQTKTQKWSWDFDLRSQASGVYTNTEWLTKFNHFQYRVGLPYLTPWAKIIHRTAIQDVFFPNDRSWSEDLKTMWKFYLNAEKISYDPAANYLWRQHSNTKETIAKEKIGAFKAIEEQLSFFANTNINYDDYKLQYMTTLINAQKAALVLNDSKFYASLSLKLKAIKKFSRR